MPFPPLRPLPPHLWAEASYGEAHGSGQPKVSQLDLIPLQPNQQVLQWEPECRGRGRGHFQVEECNVGQ